MLSFSFIPISTKKFTVRVILLYLNLFLSLILLPKICQKCDSTAGDVAQRRALA